MIKIFITAFLMAATLAFGQADKVILPVTAWPRVLDLPDKQVVNPSASDCVKEGYRLIPAKPSTPTGKQIKSEAFVQDDKDETKVKYEIIYENIPPPPVVVPELTTNVVIGRLSFSFSTNGWWRGVTWLDAPKTNFVATGE